MPAKSFQSCLTVCDHVDYSPLDSSVHGILKKESLSELLCPPPGNLPDTGIEPTSPTPPALQADSLPNEPPGKPIPYHIL